MTSLWIVLSTYCYQLSPSQSIDRFTRDGTVCIQQAEIRNSSVTVKGETAYRMVPATATVCDLAGHLWISNWTLPDSFSCMRCFKQRKYKYIDVPSKAQVWED